MSEIGKRIWNEPAVFIGLLTSIILALIAWVNGSWNTSDIIGVIAPLVSSLGIRQFVTPTTKLEDQVVSEKVP